MTIQCSPKKNQLQFCWNNFSGLFDNKDYYYYFVGCDFLRRLQHLMSIMVNTTLLSPQCAAQSVGVTNQLAVSLIQSILAAYCMISPPKYWPNDYGKEALENGYTLHIRHN